MSSKERQRFLKSLVVFSWSTRYVTQQQDLQMAKNREISIKQIQIHLSKALLSSLGREDISSSTGQIQALSGRLSLICLHLKSGLQIQIQIQKNTQDKSTEHSLWLSASHEFVLTPRDNKTCRKIGGFLQTKGIWRQVPS